MNFSTFFSIFHKLYSKHFVMGMKSVNSWNKSHIFLFLAPISTVPCGEDTNRLEKQFLAHSLIKIMCTLFSFLLLHFFKRIFCLQNQENCSFGNGIYSRFLQDAFSEKNFKKGVKLDSSSLPPFLYFQNEMTVIGKNQDSRMSKDFVMECRRGLDFCVFLSGIW